MHALTKAYIHVYVLIRPRTRRGVTAARLSPEISMGFFSAIEKNADTENK